MKRSLSLSLMALLALAPAAWAGHLFDCCNWGIHCQCPPPCDCQPPHEHHLHMPCATCEKAQKLIDELCHGDCCCIRIKAAEKLGCCLHADYCSDPEVLTALIDALECDTCWEVRREAAWSIKRQGANTHLAIAALYLASRADPNYLVRDRAREAVDLLTLCQYPCYKKLYDSIDKVVGKIKPYYHPTDCQCVHLCEDCGCFVVHVTKPEKKEEEKKEECLIEFKIVEHEGCPTGTCASHADGVPGAPIISPGPGPLPPEQLVPPLPGSGQPAPGQLPPPLPGSGQPAPGQPVPAQPMMPPAVGEVSAPPQEVIPFTPGSGINIAPETPPKAERLAVPGIR